MRKMDAQAALIHGAGFEVENGLQVLSNYSEACTNKALELLNDGRVEQVICSGHGPISGLNYPQSEATLMANYLIRHGVDSCKIETEDRSTSTVGNWAFSADIINHNGIENVLGVTARPNIPRMRLIGNFVARRTYFDLIGYVPSGAGSFRDYPREAVSGLIVGSFLALNRSTPISELPVAYDSFKSFTRADKAKRYTHRDISNVPED